MLDKKKKVSLKKMMFEEALMSNRGVGNFSKKGLDKKQVEKKSRG